MSIYAPKLECSEKDSDTVDAFYNKLENVIKNDKSRDNLVTAGDFNAKTATAALESKRKEVHIAVAIDYSS